MISTRSRAGAFNGRWVLRRLSVWEWVGVLASVGILAVTTVAAIDHERKIRAIGRASISEYYCAHRGTQCDKQKPDSIEDAWSRRERAYKGAGAVLFAVGVIAVVAVRRRQR
jgi:hypothetical protein